MKDETVYLLSGALNYRVQDRRARLTDVRLKAGESYRITPNTIHYMEAVTDCDVLEASTPDLDDVVRLKDPYGRRGRAPMKVIIPLAGRERGFARTRT